MKTAVTSIWPIKGTPVIALRYAMNPEKTSVKNQEEIAALHAIDKVVEYTANELKTEKQMFVSGVNCQIPFVQAQFMETKNRFGKTGGRTCYHGYQSFRAGEADADTAHRIGVALAEELWGNQFEVIVATHLNTEHYHNHFIVNSVSSVDGKKFSNRKPDYIRMREASDRLCKEYGLLVIKYPQGKGKNYSQWAAEKNGKPTYQSMVKADIDRAIRASTTMRDFNRVMDEMGYMFKWFRKDGSLLEHPVALPPGAKRGVRLDRLGEEYTYEGITERILRNIRKQVPFPEAEKRRIGRYRYQGSFKKARKATGLRALYFYYCYRMNTIVKHPASAKRVPVSLREDILKLDRIIAETRLLGKYGIETASQLAERKQHATEEIHKLFGQRKEMRNALKRIARKGDDKAVSATKTKIQALSGRLRQLYKEVKLCDSIAERSGLIKESSEEISSQKITKRKEKYPNEHSRRRSGTGRQDVTKWR